MSSQTVMPSFPTVQDAMQIPACDGTIYIAETSMFYKSSASPLVTPNGKTVVPTATPYHNWVRVDLFKGAVVGEPLKGDGSGKYAWPSDQEVVFLLLSEDSHVVLEGELQQGRVYSLIIAGDTVHDLAYRVTFDEANFRNYNGRDPGTRRVLPTHIVIYTFLASSPTMLQMPVPMIGAADGGVRWEYIKDFAPSRPYVEGDYCYFSGLRVVADSDHPVGRFSWINWRPVNVSDVHWRGIYNPLDTYEPFDVVTDSEFSNDVYIAKLRHLPGQEHPVSGDGTIWQKNVPRL